VNYDKLTYAGNLANLAEVARKSALFVCAGRHCCGGWRIGLPRLPDHMTSLERKLARATHVAFYVLLFAMPLTGWMMSSAKKYSVSWFGLFTWPNLIGKNENSVRFFARHA